MASATSSTNSVWHSLSRLDFDVSNFRTGAKNLFDHDILGNSNIFFPLTIAACPHSWLGSYCEPPRIAGRAQFHAAYSHQYAEGAGGVTGGLTDFEPPDEGYFFLDHDQRHTLSTGVNLVFALAAVGRLQCDYGSGLRWRRSGTSAFA